MSSLDFFEDQHADPNEEELIKKISAVKTATYQTDSTISDGGLKVVASIPELQSSASLKRKRPSFEDDAAAGAFQGKVKKRLAEPSQKVLKTLSAEAAALSRPISAYQDVLFAARSPRNAGELRSLLSLHALNHVFKTRDRIVKNSERMRVHEQQGNDSAALANDVRDQGFTRPKVLILLETRSAATKYVDTLMALAEPAQQENKKRFQDEFATSDGQGTADEAMPEDYRELFDGNDDNHWVVSIKFTRKTCKFYSGFYDSDIILASPLGLRRAMTRRPEKPDFDYLSSIELLLVDQADAMLMQKFEHVQYILQHLNQPPKDPSRTDFARVRPYYLNDQQLYLRQTVVLTAHLTPELNALFKTHMLNTAGKLKITPAAYPGAMLTLSSYTSTPVRQTFTRIPAATPGADPDARFEHFTKAVLPALQKLPAAGMGVLVFVPSYFDFVRVRQHLEAQTDALAAPVGALDEYADVAAARRARSLFAAGRTGVLLYSGRAHHFRRYALKGVKRAVLYGVPDNAAFYAEVVGMVGRSVEEGRVGEADEAWVRCLFSRWEVLALERVVGSKRVRRMVRDEGAAGDTFEFR